MSRGEFSATYTRYFIVFLCCSEVTEELDAAGLRANGFFLAIVHL